MNGNIDWTRMVTKEMKEQAAARQYLAAVVAETAAYRASAVAAIAPLQDTVDIDEATEAEVVALKAWEKYRVALNRLPEQAGYPDTIDWPAPPAWAMQEPLSGMSASDPGRLLFRFVFCGHLFLTVLLVQSVAPPECDDTENNQPCYLIYGHYFLLEN
ncbi:hypothetical protein CQ065_10925 [Pseudomonas sp. MYb187]|uniref:tail fiber assembly protein n=2 Tax=Pseudomonas TaxID=286 RepID=UPI000CFC0AB4|nr:tail fiber assembly protein [Pseudomonas sp. MYb187]PRA65824.1 hypothetical protein CQ065_10925 [Pseudomonas sp. MYb187]